MTDSSPPAAIAARRSALYWLFAEIVLTCPDRGLVERLRRELQAPFGDVNPVSVQLEQARRTLPQPEDAAQIERLAVEHTRLFGGLKEGYGLPPPLESIHDEDALAPEVMTEVARCYEDAGFALNDRSTPADHLGLELRFMALLCHREAESWHANDSALAMQTRARQRDFLQAHLGRWAPGRWQETVTAARHDFYRRVAAIAADMLLDDCALAEETQAA